MLKEEKRRRKRKRKEERAGKERSPLGGSYQHSRDSFLSLSLSNANGCPSNHTHLLCFIPNMHHHHHHYCSRCSMEICYCNFHQRHKRLHHHWYFSFFLQLTLTTYSHLSPFPQHFFSINKDFTSIYINLQKVLVGMGIYTRPATASTVRG